MLRKPSCPCERCGYALRVPDIPAEVQNNIEKHRLLKPGQPVLVAVSGGVDSMVLLDVLHRLRSKQRWQLTVAHLNHRLRGRSSDADERLVRRVATEKGLPVETGRVDVRTLAKKGKLSIEIAARKARHDFLARAARKRGIRTIALAHHADDQVELFFLRLLRGSGGEGLSGMKWRNASPADREIEIVRPLLNTPKPALEEYASENGILFREDVTNLSPDIQRNRVRHELLPLLREKYQPAVASTVLRVAEIVSAEADYVTNIARDWLKSKRETFAKLPVAVQRRVVQLQLIERGVMPDYDLVEKLRLRPGEAVAVKWQGASGGVGFPVSNLELSASSFPKVSSLKFQVSACRPLTVLRDADGTVRLREIGIAQFRKDRRSVSISGRRGETEFAGAKINWAIGRQSGQRFPKFRSDCEFFDADKVGPRILLRHWQPGDRFQPIGMPVAVKVQDLLVNQKVPKEIRKGLIVAVTGAGELFWVEKLRISERFRLSERTKRRLQWRWQRL